MYFKQVSSAAVIAAGITWSGLTIGAFPASAEQPCDQQNPQACQPAPDTGGGQQGTSPSPQTNAPQRPASEAPQSPAPQAPAPQTTQSPAPQSPASPNPQSPPAQNPGASAPQPATPQNPQSPQPNGPASPQPNAPAAEPNNPAPAQPLAPAGARTRGDDQVGGPRDTPRGFSTPDIGAPPAPAEGRPGWNDGAAPGVAPPNWDGPPPADGWDGEGPPGGWNRAWDGPVRDIGQAQSDFGPFNYNTYRAIPVFNYEFGGWGFWYFGVWVPLF
jgi:hypothetical protein